MTLHVVLFAFYASRGGILLATMRKSFDYESLTYESRAMIHDALSETTMKHIDASNGLFSPLGFDISKHPSQKLETVHLEPAPTTAEEVEFLASAAAPKLYPFIVDEVNQSSTPISAMRDYLQAGESVHILVSPHTKMDDLPELAVGIGTKMDEDHWQDQNGEIISRGVSTIGIFADKPELAMAASEIIQKAGHVFMSFPRTESIGRVSQSLADKGIDIDVGQLISTNNNRMKDEINQWKGRRLFHKIGRQALGKSLMIAVEGATPKIEYSYGKIDSIKLNVVARGTLDLVKGDYVLPVVLWSDTENPILRFGPIQRITTMEALENIHHWQATTLARDLGLASSKVHIGS